MLLLLLALLWRREGAEGQGGPGMGPQGDYWLQVQGAEVQEGLCVRVPCKCSYPEEGWSPSDTAFGYWFRKGASVQLVATNNPGQKVRPEAQGRFRLLGNPRDCDCSLDIRDARRSDSGTYFFRVERGPIVRYSYTQNLLSVRVTALTDTPDILISGTLESGRPSNLTCSVPWDCKWGIPPIFSWMSAALTFQGPRTHRFSVLTLTPRPQDHGTSLTCQVTLPRAGVTTMRTIHLNVTYSPQNLTVTVFRENNTAPTALENGSSLSVLEGQALHLVCVVNSNPPARLSWARGRLTLCSPTPGVLELPGVREADEGEYACRAQNALGSQHVFLSLLLQRAWPLSEGMLGAVLGASAMALIFLVLCIVVLLVRSHRKKATKPAAGAGNTGMESANAVTRSGSQGPLIESWASNLPPDAAMRPSGAREELHYATLHFGEKEPWGRQEQVATGVEYSEIRIHK
ncbi:sialic acid-binding Ig-like lectin 8 [Suricata suricatta]|uniref:Ig-like domain-containing protein n=1 Tax=Suricata suricatta TaxID=37032 RepID=A0A673VDD0_SURSU|nr:sialic acid-binding Ig-like lectin 8 [Suricata suricatta]